MRINPGRLVACEIKFSGVRLLVGPRYMHLLHVALLTPRILKRLLHFWGNLCIPANGFDSCP